MKNHLLIFLSFIALLSCSPDLPEDVKTAYDALPDQLDYNVHVKPVLSDKCFKCHGPDENQRKAGLRLDNQTAAFDDLPESPGKVAIDPGDLSDSELFHRIISNDPEYRMPEAKSHLSLSAKEKATLIKWIEQGAAYKQHWAFVKPIMPDVPEVANKDGVYNPIDNFILQRLEQEKLKPSKPADKEILLRRVSLDLTGLPPTLKELDDFLSDKSENAYEKQVDRMLASPHYGEKMATQWLDLARFSDSHGYTVDRIIDMSPYRDWVISAFNNNYPYDKFIQWQLAGDLLPEPTKEMLIATAFNRVHPQNAEGGIIEEEFQTEYVIDRVNTAGIAFMGMSVGCARCHDHKFDPLTQKNYYEMFSFFNNVREAGQISWDDSMPTPTALLPTPEQEKVIQYIKTKITTKENEIANIPDQSKADFEKWIRSKNYQSLTKEKIPTIGLQAQFNFDDGSLRNVVKPSQTGAMKRELSNVPGDRPVFTNESSGKSLLLNGDEWLDLHPIGIFRKSDPFSIAIKVFVPQDFKEGVIFHKSIAERLNNYRGYNLYVRDSSIQVMIAHTAPSDAITKVSTQTIPRNQWVQFTMTYDGSSKASGLKLFMNGIELELETVIDQLHKDILLNSKEQPGLQIGAWNRGWGLKNGKVDDILVYNRSISSFEAQVLAGKSSWSSALTTELSTTALSHLKSYYFSAVNAEILSAQNELRFLRQALSDSTEYIKEVMIMQEMPQPRKSHLLKRGNYDQFGEQVFPNTPEAILPFPKDLPKNRGGLASWLTDPDHPLTSRVAVNRFWQNFFGIGLVKTSEDFGNQGEMPSHLELLDYLAITFRDSGWDMKKLCKEIAMSATYRQDSKTDPAMLVSDPENRLLARGPSARLSAEMVRDNALMASGLLNEKVGGKSVKAYQPEGLWEINNSSYRPDHGDELYRRSLYVLVKRSVPNPTLATFDASSRSYCVARRQYTNTPLQALVTLNDPTFVEASKVMGEAMVKSKENGISDAYRRLTGRTPTSQEIALLEKLKESQWLSFRGDIRKTKGWLSAGQYQIDKNLDPAMVAANAVVASVILNSDASLTKR